MVRFANVLPADVDYVIMFFRLCWKGSWWHENVELRVEHNRFKAEALNQVKYVEAGVTPNTTF